MPFIIKQDDLRPYLQGQLIQPNGSPFNLSLASALMLVMRRANTQQVHLKKPCVVTDAVNGKFEYRWSGSDTATAGTYEAEIEVNWAGEPQTVPANTYYTITIVDDIG